LQLIDTIAIVSSLNRQSRHHSIASKYLNLVSQDEQTFVPSIILLEFDLVMKGRSYTFQQRKDTFDWLDDLIPDPKLLSNSVSSLKKAIELQETGMSYFDSVISAAALDQNAVVLTPDPVIAQIAKTKW
jgi:predicted nucleic-acid-binding protein